MPKEIKNATIERTMIGIEDHGILTCMLHLDYGGSGQGFGGYEITLNAGQWIQKIIETVGVEKWEDLKGKHIRVESEHSKVYKIGHIIEDRWFNPEEDLDKI